MILKLALNILTLKKGTLYTSAEFALAQSVPGDTRGQFALYVQNVPEGYFLGGERGTFARPNFS